MPPGRIWHTDRDVPLAHAPVRRARLPSWDFHHVALATNDTEATHRFYTEVMGFELVKVVASETPNASQTPNGDGFSKHFFYSTAGTDPSRPSRATRG